MVKNLPVMQKTQVQSLGQEDCWRRRRQPTPVFLPGESHWQRGLVGYSPWGHKESDTTEQLTLDVYFMGFDRSHCSVSPIAGPYKVFSLWGFSSSGKPTAFQPGHILSFPSILKNLLLHLPEKEQPFPVTETFSRVCVLGGRGAVSRDWPHCFLLTPAPRAAVLYPSEVESLLIFLPSSTWSTSAPACCFFSLPYLSLQEFFTVFKIWEQSTPVLFLFHL